MSANPSGQKPEEQPAQDRSTMFGEQAYQQQKIAELDQAVADGTVKPEDLPTPPPPLSWT
ncbi:hypothetical protein ACQEU6_15475 [Spirillospora sp. CA-108201]